MPLAPANAAAAAAHLGCPVSSRRPWPRPALLWLGGVLACCLLLAGCTASKGAVQPHRLLPTHIKRVYIPMMKNQSRLYAAQRDLTLALTDELISDGRLEVTTNDHADVRIEGVVSNYREAGRGPTDDRFNIFTQLDMEVKLALWDPYDADRDAPLSRYTVTASIQYVSDPRRSIAETDTEGRERLMQQMSRNILQTLMYSTPDGPTQEDTLRTKRYQETRGADKFAPTPITEPKMPAIRRMN